MEKLCYQCKLEGLKTVMQEAGDKYICAECGYSYTKIEHIPPNHEIIRELITWHQFGADCSKAIKRLEEGLGKSL